MHALKFLLIIFLVASIPALSQTKNAGVLKGKVVDSTLEQASLKDATISILHAKDSSLATYGLSKEDGTFEINNIPSGAYVGVITFSGYQEVVRNFTIAIESTTVDIGTVYLAKLQNVLEEVIVKTTPITINGDTTEFNASHFKTIPNASTEDLLKKLPGVEVERDGTIKAQGETVTRILVDGKRFFGNDPKMATRNLPAEIIEKIQVIDAQSEQSAFSGFDDGDRVRTINIITKKDRKKGLFGKGSLAVGDEGRNAHAISANRINGDQKISFIGQRNNINNQNFSVQDFLGNMNAGGGRGGGGRGGGGANVYAANASGISTSTGAGINYNDVFSTNTQVAASYFYNNVDATNNRDRFRETFVANDSSLFNNNNLLSRNRNENHRANIELDHVFDSANSILVRSDYSRQATNNFSETRSFTTKGKLTNLSQVNAVNSSHNFGHNLNNSILFRHKFQKRGRTFSLNLTQSSNTNDRHSSNLSYNNRFGRGIDTIDQISSTVVDGKSLGANLSYTEPISAKSMLELTYNYNNNQSQSDQQTYKLDKLTGKHSIEIPNLTNLFQNANLSHRGGANFRVQINPQWNYSVGMAVQHTDLVSNNLSKKTSLDQSFINLFPNFNVQYRQNRSKNLRFTYRGRTRQPNVTQLQDVINNTNILNIRSGNPSLKQEFSNDFTLTYNAFNRKTYNNLSITLNGATVSNKIANTTFINSTNDSVLVDGYYLIPGAQFTKPRNINGAFNAGSNINYSFVTKNPKINVNLTSRFSYNRDVNLFNDVKSFTHNYILGGTARVTVNFKDYVDINFASTSTYNIARYEIQSNQNGNFFNQRFSFEPTYTSKTGWILSNDFDYIISRGQSAGFNQSIPLWNAGLAKLFLKGRVGELRLSVFDLLNANQSFSRNVEQNYIEDIRTDVLNRYFLLSFTYHLRKFKKPQGKNVRQTNIPADRSNRGNGTGNSNRQVRGAAGRN